MKFLGQSKWSFLLVFILLVGTVFTVQAQDRAAVTDIINQVNGKLTDFQYNFNGDVNRGSVNQREELQTSDLMKDLRADLQSLRERVSNGTENKDDVQSVITSAQAMQDHILRLKLSAYSLNDWKSSRELFDRLASNYGIQTSWSIYAKPTQSNPKSNNSLTGTYQLDKARSDNVSDVVQTALKNSTAQNRDEASLDLAQKLESPELLAIDLNGTGVNIASNLSPQITLAADGRDKTQTLPDGTSVRIRTILRGQDLTVAKLGGENDYTVIFSSIDGGSSLKVTRRITTDYLSQTIFTESIYTKTDTVARLDVYDNQGNSATAGTYPQQTTPQPTNIPTVKAQRSGQFVVRNGEIIVGTLNNLVSTKISQNNDRFTMTVSAPAQYRGATIEGYVSGIDRSNRNPVGKSKLTLNFETIRLTDSSSYDFAGFLQSITDTKGKNVKIDEEGVAQKSSTRETIKRGAIGAGAGAIIGAIFGGAKGAIIGATIGGGAGAGSVAVQNSGDLELEKGSSLTVQSSSPIS